MREGISSPLGCWMVRQDYKPQRCVRAIPKNRASFFVQFGQNLEANEKGTSQALGEGTTTTIVKIAHHPEKLCYSFCGQNPFYLYSGHHWSAFVIIYQVLVFLEFHIFEVIQDELLCIFFLLLSVMFLIFNHVAVDISNLLLLIDKQYFIV